MRGPAPLHGCSPHSPPSSRRSSSAEWRCTSSAASAGTRRTCPVEQRVRDRLNELSRRLGDADWLDGGFSAGDLLMVTVLRRLNGSGLLEEYPNVSAYVARGEARPAYQRAFDDQLAVFTAASGGG